MKNKNLQSIKSIRRSSLIPYPLALSPLLGIFGPIKNPLSETFGVKEYETVTTGLPLFISNIVRLITVVAGLWMFFNLITAGFTYLTAGAEAEKINKAWAMIWQSILGLAVIVSAFAVTAIISQLLFGDYTTILKPVIYGPGSATK